MSQRLLILTPRGRDADVAASLFGKNEIEALICRDIAALMDAMKVDVGAVMLTEEVLAESDTSKLADWIGSQPTWSDLPFIVLANGHSAPRSTAALKRLQSLGNTVLLERPLHAEAMLGAVRSALKARFRQYQVRDAIAKLNERERELRFTLSAGKFGSWTLDLLTNELDASEMCRINFGRDPDVPFTYQQLLDAVHPDDRTRMAGAVRDSIVTGSDYDIEYRIITPVGELRWALIRGRPVYAADGMPIRMAGVSIDITDRKRGEAHKACLAELAEAIRQLHQESDLAYAAAEILGRTLGVSRVGYATIDPVGETLHVERDWNAPGVESLKGVLKLRDYGSFIDDLKRGNFISIADVRKDARTALAAAALESRSARSFVNMPVIEQGRLAAVLYVNDGHVRQWTSDEQALIKEVGERTRTSVERSRVDAALRESEIRYRTLFESVEQGFCVLDMLYDDVGRPVDYIFVEVNPAFKAQTDLGDAVGRRISELVPDSEQSWCELYGEVASTGIPLRIEDYSQLFGRWYDVYAYRIGAPEQRRVAVLFNDVSERKHAEAQIRQLNETLERQVADRTAELRQFRDIVDATTSAICAFDQNYRLIAFNKAHNDEFRRVNGFDTKLGEVFYELFVPEQRLVMRALMTRALSGEAFTETAVFGRPELNAPVWEISYTPLRDASGAIIGAFHLATDISDRLRRETDLAIAQEALRQSQKMEAMGTLTGGVAHDFNNLLTPIVGTLEMLQRKGLGNERDQRLIANAALSADRAKVLVQRLLAFARRQPLQATAVDLATLVTGMADLVASTIGPQIRVAVDVADNLPAAKADPNQLEMAILNLAVNSRDAMPDGGTLRITVRPDTVGISNEANVAQGSYLRLSIADTGSGMDEATLKRAVEPFFSTKGIGKGTGLGLSMVHGLASQLGGALTIHSTLGVGTNIELWLPQSDEPMVGFIPDKISPVIKVKGTALLVDDEDLVRTITAEMLTDMGFKVVEASSAQEALKLVYDGLHPDVLVTDHLMPGMSGTELSRRLRNLLPEIKVLVVSGYAEHEGIDADLPRLTKPFLSDQLAEMLTVLT